MGKREEERLRKEQERLNKELARTKAMSVYEEEYKDYRYICGIDEAGRGPLAIIVQIFPRHFVAFRRAGVFPHIGRAGKEVWAVAQRSHVEGIPGNLVDRKSVV